MLHAFENIPSILRERPNWVNWGIQGAPLKSPFNPYSLLSGRARPAKAGVRETWGSYADAAECVSRGLAKGIGYEFDGSLYGIDLDQVISEAGALSPQAWEVVEKLNSYTEISPSGRGLHIFVFAPGADIVRHRKKGCFLEIYNEGRYFTVTGLLCSGKGAIMSRVPELQAIHDKFLLPATQKMALLSLLPPVPDTGQEQFLRIGLARDKTFAALWAGARRYGDESADDIALMNKLAYWCNGDPESTARAFLQSPHYTQKDPAHKKKCQRDDYLAGTAKNSCTSLYSTAAADSERWHEQRRRLQHIRQDREER